MSKESAAHARRPLSPRAFWAGLEPGERGVVLLRAPPPRRVFVPGGTFLMGAVARDDIAARELCEREPLGKLCHSQDDAHFDVARELVHEKMAHQVTVSPYWLDRTEVTVEAYGRCVAVGACGAPGYPPLDARFDRPDYPVTHVSFEDASDYCRFQGGRVPTEAEWELAARGEAQRIFPWGVVWNPHDCNHGSFAADDTDATDGFRGLAPVGSFPSGATPLGLLDLAGNVAEWVQDRWEPNPDVPLGYAPAPAVNPVVTKGAIRIVRGGSYESPSFAVRTTARKFLFGDGRRSDVGFRCAYDATK